MPPATSLDCHPSSIADARDWTAGVVGPHITSREVALELCEDVVLCVSELVTNALQAGCGAMTLTIDVDESRVRIQLTDDAPGVPTRRYPSVRDLRGRGLMFVDAVAQAWGVDESPAGKTVWADFPRATRLSG